MKYSLTPFVQGILYESINSENQNTYNCQIQLDFFEAIDKSALEESLRFIIKHYEVLRSSFNFSQSPEHIIHDHVPLILNYQCINATEEVANIAAAQLNIKFDFSQPPLFRFILLKISQDHYHLIWTFHHTLLGGPSAAAIVQDLLRHYDAVNKSLPLNLPKLNSYENYLTLITNHQNENHKDYWKNLFADFHFSPAIPGFLSYQKKSTTKSKEIVFSQRLFNRLESFAKQQKLSIGCILNFAWGILLAKYSFNDDVVFGTVRAFPKEISTEHAGLLINILPMRLQINADEQILEQLQSFQKQQTALKKYVLEPLQQIKAYLDLGVDAPIFQTIVDYKLLSVAATLKKNGVLENRAVSTIAVDNYPLSLEISGTDDCALIIKAHFAGNLYQEQFISLLLEHYCTLLEIISCESDKLVKNIDILNVDEKNKFQRWKYGAVKENSNRTVIEYFEAQVKNNPQQTSVIFGETHLTFAQLNAYAESIAHELIKQDDINNQTVIALYFQPGIDFIAALLAVAKLGAIYLLLDPEQPCERINFILNDANVAIILTTDGLIKKPLALDNLLLMAVDQTHIVANEKVLQRKQSLKNPAYIIYTSGSTGKPKGVVITQEGLTNHMEWLTQQIKIKKSEVILQRTTPSFDAAIWEIWLPLMMGATLCIASQKERKDMALLANCIQQNQISIAQFFPQLLDVFLQQSAALACSSLRIVVSGGGALTASLVNNFYQTLPHCDLYNFYGPTEATIDTTYYKVSRSKLALSQIPIGKPIDNMSVCVLDKQMQEVPVNVPGELYISGKGLALGYLDETLTANKFLPLTNQDSNVFYKTGDIVKWGLDGDLYFLGRSDDQIKHNGYRIELSEIESVLGSHSGVANALVIYQQQKIISYYQAEKEIDRFLLIEFLRQFLPSYMLPSDFIFVKQMPRQLNGKVDRSKLPLPAPVLTTVETDSELSDEYQQRVKLIWQQLLNIEHINIHDNFFALGGNSLLTMTLSIRLQEAFHLPIPITIIYQFSTIASLSAWIRARQAGDSNAEKLFTMISGDENITEPFPLSDIQQAYWIGRDESFELGGVSTHGYFEYQFDQLDIERLETAFNFLIKRHAALRTIFNKNMQQYILPKVPYYKFIIHDFINVSAKKAEAQLLAIRNRLSHQIFPADIWPLFDVSVSLLPNKKIILHMSFDALTLDGWSFLLLQQEWSKLYLNLQHKLPELIINFRDYILALKKINQSKTYENAKSYWLNKINHFPLPAQLPIMRKQAMLQHAKFSRCAKTLPKQQWLRLKQKISWHHLTPTVFLLSVFAEIINFWSQSSQFAINLTLFNRLPLHPEINQIMGDFTSLILLGIDYQANENFLERTMQLQQQLAEGLENRFFSGIEVIRELNRQRKQTNHIFYPVVFTSLLGFAEEEDLNSIFGLPTYGITQTPQVHLDFKVYEINGQLIIEWDYLQQIFPDNLIETMHASYCQLIEKFIEQDEIWLDNIVAGDSLIETKQREIKSIGNLNTTDKLLHQLFLEQAAKTPHATAIVFQEKRFTYLEVLQQACQLAHYLQALKVTPNQLVAVVMEKSWEQIIACLGILLAGAAYLPIDPHLPDRRISHILEVGEVIAVITQSKYKGKLQSITQEPTIALEDDFLKTYPIQLPKQSAKPNDLAYVIFTSGSTGTPKGVSIEHHAVVNTILDINQRFAVNEHDSVLALSNLNFDLSVYDIFGLLAVGGKVVYPKQDEVTNPEAWVNLIQAENITLWNSVPMFMQMLTEYFAGNETLISSLRLILLSGDWIPLALPEKIFKLLGNQVELISLGGATEAAIWSILYPIRSIDASWESIPYGKAMMNQSVMVLNKQLQQCPDWVVGDLYIAGQGLARDYWKDSVKTNAAFIFHPETQQRLYKTGDAGCYLPDGNIKFLGRLDNQIKIAGHRIELGEIESILRKILMCEHVCVQTKTLNEQKELIAYIVSKEESKKIEYQLRLPGLRTFVSDALAAVPAPYQVDRKMLFAKKSYRQFTQEKLTQDIVERWLSTASNIFNPDRQVLSNKVQLSQWLSCISACLTNDRSLPKYPYASAGSLYPVQIYLSIPNGFDIPAGCYYYHPVEQMLYLINENLSNTENLTFHLVVNRDAIEPIYGAHWRLFAEIEAGAMLALLAENYFIQPENITKISLVESLKLTAQHHVVGSWILAKHPTDYLINFNLNLFPNQIDGLQNAEYSYQNGLLIGGKKLTENFSDTFIGFSEQSAVLKECAGIIVWPQSIEPLQLGYMSQKLMQLGLGFNLGTCLLGNIVDDQKFYNVALAFGCITQAQLADEKNSKATETSYGLELYCQNKLRKYLPQYMIPKHYCLLDRLPLTINGKVDYQALPLSHAKQGPDRSEYASPRNSTEYTLCCIWQALLNVPQINIYDEFFNFGGNSLLMIQMIKQVNEKFSCNISIAAAFKCKTVAELARLINDDAVSHYDSLITLKETGQGLPLFFIHSGDGLSFAYRSLVPHLANHPVYGINNPHFNDEINKFDSLEAMAAYYVSLLPELPSHQPYVLCGWSFGGVVAFEMAQQLQAKGKKVGAVILLDSIVYSDFLDEKQFDLNFFVNNFDREVLYDLSAEERRLFMNEFRNNTCLLLKYRPKPYAGQVFLLKATENKLMQSDKMLCNGWDSYVNELTVYPVSANHYQLLGRDFVAEVAKGLRFAMAKNLAMIKARLLNCC